MEAAEAVVPLLVVAIVVHVVLLHLYYYYYWFTTIATGILLLRRVSVLGYDVVKLQYVQDMRSSSRYAICSYRRLFHILNLTGNNASMIQRWDDHPPTYWTWWWQAPSVTPRCLRTKSNCMQRTLERLLQECAVHTDGCAHTAGHYSLKNANVVCVERVENHELWQRYAEKRAALQLESDGLNTCRVLGLNKKKTKQALILCK